MCRLKIIGELTKLGYSKFYNSSNFLRSSLSYHPATFRNLKNDLIIYTFCNESNDKFFMWSFIYNQIVKGFNWEDHEDSINFGGIQFYINSDHFLIPEVESMGEIYHFNEQNTFTRPTINSIDNRIDLGDKRFIVSEVGILFSVHEKVEHKILNFDMILYDEIKIIVEKTMVGTLNSSFEITSCHLIPNN